MSDLVQTDVSQADVPSGHPGAPEVVPCEECGRPQAGPAGGIGYWCENPDCGPEMLQRMKKAAQRKQIAPSGHLGFEAKAREIVGEYVSSAVARHLVPEIASALSEAYEAGRDLVQTHAEPALPPSGHPNASDTFQSRVDEWLLACFGEQISRDRTERNHRFLEEALELAQAGHCTQGEAHQLVDYVYGRDVGEIGQEVGGVMNTLAALCLAYGLDVNKAADVELARCWTKIDKIRAKQAAKPKFSPLPEAQVTAPKPQGEFETKFPVAQKMPPYEYQKPADGSGCVSYSLPASQRPAVAPEAPKATDAPDVLSSPATSPETASREASE